MYTVSILVLVLLLCVLFATSDNDPQSGSSQKQKPAPAPTASVAEDRRRSVYLHDSDSTQTEYSPDGDEVEIESSIETQQQTPGRVVAARYIPQSGTVYLLTESQDNSSSDCPESHRQHRNTSYRHSPSQEATSPESDTLQQITESSESNSGSEKSEKAAEPNLVREPSPSSRRQSETQIHDAERPSRNTGAIPKKKIDDTAQAGPSDVSGSPSSTRKAGRRRTRREQPRRASAPPDPNRRARRSGTRHSTTPPATGSAVLELRRRSAPEKHGQYRQCEKCGNFEGLLPVRRVVFGSANDPSLKPCKCVTTRKDSKRFVIELHKENKEIQERPTYRPGAVGHALRARLMQEEEDKVREDCEIVHEAIQEAANLEMPAASRQSTVNIHEHTQTSPATSSELYYEEIQSYVNLPRTNAGVIYEEIRSYVTSPRPAAELIYNVMRPYLNTPRERAREASEETKVTIEDVTDEEDHCKESHGRTLQRHVAFNLSSPESSQQKEEAEFQGSASRDGRIERSVERQFEDKKDTMKDQKDRKNQLTLERIASAADGTPSRADRSRLIQPLPLPNQTIPASLLGSVSSAMVRRQGRIYPQDLRMVDGSRFAGAMDEQSLDQIRSWIQDTSDARDGELFSDDSSELPRVNYGSDTNSTGYLVPRRPSCPAPTSTEREEQPPRRQSHPNTYSRQETSVVPYTTNLQDAPVQRSRVRANLTEQNVAEQQVYPDPSSSLECLPSTPERKSCPCYPVHRFSSTPDRRICTCNTLTPRTRQRTNPTSDSPLLDSPEHVNDRSRLPVYVPQVTITAPTPSPRAGASHHVYRPDVMYGPPSALPPTYLESMMETYPLVYPRPEVEWSQSCWSLPSINCRRCWRFPCPKRWKTSLRAVRHYDARLPCGEGRIFLDGPDAYILWLKNDDKFLYRFPNEDTIAKSLNPNNIYGKSCTSHDHCYDDTSLFLPKVEDKNAGIYRCRVHYQGSSSVDYVIDLKIVDPTGTPKLYDEKGKQIITPYLGPISLGSNFTVVCEVTISDPPTTIVWLRNGVKVKQIVSDRPGLLREKIQIIGATRNELDAHYQCKASNSDVTEAMIASVVVKMYLPPMKVEIRLNNNYDFEVGQPRVVDCVVVGCVPTPNINWYHGGKRLKATAHKELHDGNYTVSSLTLTASIRDNKKLLSCRVHNAYLPTVYEDNVTLHVGFRPVCTTKANTVIRVVPGKKKSVTCAVKTDSPPVRFIWIFRDRRTVYTETLVHPHSTGQYYTRLEWVPDIDEFGILECFTENVFGIQKLPCSYIITESQNPDTPICRMDHQVGDARLSVPLRRISCWNNDWDDGITQIHLQVLDKAGLLVYNETNTTGNFTISTDLECTNCTARVFSSNSWGNSPVLVMHLSPTQTQSQGLMVIVGLSVVCLIIIVVLVIIYWPAPVQPVTEEPSTEKPGKKPCIKGVDGLFHREPDLDQEARMQDTANSCHGDNQNHYNATPCRDLDEQDLCSFPHLEANIIHSSPGMCNVYSRPSHGCPHLTPQSQTGSRVPLIQMTNRIALRVPRCLISTRMTFRQGQPLATVSQTPGFSRIQPLPHPMPSPMRDIVQQAPSSSMVVDPLLNVKASYFV